ncbi:MAG: NAD(P)H-dependent glycerol-3-phosphate dehydrogenase [Emergencia sp.]
MKKIGVIGAGSFGTALAQTLADKGHSVRLTSVTRSHLEEMAESRENSRYLPGIKLNDNIEIAYSTEEALDGADIVLFAAPAQKFRTAFEKAIPFLEDNMIVVNVAKGIEVGSLMRMSEIAKLLKPDTKYVVLSGPSHAEEIARKMPTTIVVASDHMEYAEEVQDVFMTERLRVYTNDDVCGVELGGALKNIIALGAGISDGIGYGDNAKAALMTRGITEMCRLGKELGADIATFAGLTGVGDLIVTCTSMHSRNRRCGIMIGEGLKPAEAVEKVGMVVEGMTTAEAAYELSRRAGIEMPITEAIYSCIKEKITAAEAVSLLMGRDRKNEKNI